MSVAGQETNTVEGADLAQDRGQGLVVGIAVAGEDRTVHQEVAAIVGLIVETGIAAVVGDIAVVGLIVEIDTEIVIEGAIVGSAPAKHLVITLRLLNLLT